MDFSNSFAITVVLYAAEETSLAPWGELRRVSEEVREIEKGEFHWDLSPAFFLLLLRPLHFPLSVPQKYKSSLHLLLNCS